MKKDKVLIIIKPDGVKKKLVGECLKRFENKNLDIMFLKIVKLKKQIVRKFYSHLKKRLDLKLFEDIVNYLSSGGTVIGILEGKKGFEKVKKICGDTNPRTATKGTIRNEFSEDDLEIKIKEKKATRNIIYFSNNKQDYEKEIRILKQVLK